MAHDNKVVHLKNQSLRQRFTLPSSLVRLRDVSGHSLKAVMSAFFDQADDALFELADRSGTNEDQSAYFDAMRELRLRRKTMTVSILQYVSRAFNEIGRFKPGVGSNSLDDIDQDSLSLLDHSQLEQQVAIDNLVNKLRNQHLEAIRLLNARVSHLLPDVKLSDSQMPLSPEVICGGLSDACTDLDIDIRAKLVVLKLFDRLLGGILGELYKNANKTLVQEGVLPGMKRAPTEGKTSGSAPSQGKSRHTEQGVESSRTSSGTEYPAGGDVQATFTELSALLHGGQGSDGNGAGGARAVGVIDSGTLMTRLSQIQTNTLEWDSAKVIPLSSQLKTIFVNEEGHPLKAGQVDSDVINLVSMLFDFILEDRQLHSVMKAQISRLQIPVLKVALSDKNFFNRGGHPVRKLLNELAMAAMGWTEKKEGQRDPLRDKIESVVERVLNEFTDNVDLFTELLNDFGHFMDLDRRRRELVEQRLRDAEEGRARQEQASSVAGDLINELRDGRELPEPINRLLDEALAKYLQWILLRQGSESDRWHKARQLTENLVWTVDPRPITDQTRSQLLRTIPGVVDGLRSALQEISWDPFATDSAIRDLELTHVDVFQRLVTTSKKAPEQVPEPPKQEAPVAPVSAPEPNTVPEPTESVAPEVVDAAPASSQDASSATAEAATTTEPDPLAEWLQRAESLRVGSWVEMNRDGNRSRCKLAAFIKATGKYIFVNRSGAKVAEYYRDDLALALQAQDISMLDDGLIFDRALESIIDNLRTNRKD